MKPYITAKSAVRGSTIIDQVIAIASRANFLIEVAAALNSGTLGVDEMRWISVGMHAIALRAAYLQSMLNTRDEFLECYGVSLRWSDIPEWVQLVTVDRNGTVVYHEEVTEVRDGPHWSRAGHRSFSPMKLTGRFSNWRTLRFARQAEEGAQ
jgi:hypothetical protein